MDDLLKNKIKKELEKTFSKAKTNELLSYIEDGSKDRLDDPVVQKEFIEVITNEN